MKPIILFTAYLFLLSCSTKKAGTINPVVTLTSECAKNAECSLKIFAHKSMTVKNDNFGRPYYEMTDNPEKNIIQYTYSRIVKGNIQDGGYREEIVFEVDPAAKPQSLSDATLQNSKMLFGRFCFCKGQTGYYKVEKGSLAVTSASGQKNVVLEFSVDDVPQITKKIAFDIK